MMRRRSEHGEKVILLMRRRMGIAISPSTLLQRPWDLPYPPEILNSSSRLKFLDTSWLSMRIHGSE
jgi:hypothetical protein